MAASTSRDVARMLEAVPGEPKVVEMCNRVLHASGLMATVHTEEDVRVICSQTSVFVAACEAVTGRSLNGINRRPESDGDRAGNINRVIEEIAHLLRTDLHHISGQRIALGDMHDIFNLVEIMSALSYLKPTDRAAAQPEVAAPTEEAAGNATKDEDDSLTRPFEVKVRRSGKSTGKARRAPGSAPDRKVMKDAVQTIAALGNELSDLETSVYGRRKTKPRRMPQPEPSRPLTEYIIPELEEARYPGRGRPVVFNPPRLRTAMREQERFEQKVRKARRSLVGRPLTAYTRADMDQELRKRAEEAAPDDADGVTALERRQERLAKIISARAAEAGVQAGGAGGEGPKELKAAPGVRTKYVKLRRQSKKVKLAYGSLVNRYSSDAYYRLSSAAQWHRANHKRVQNKLGCPYPEVAVHGDGGIGKGILASGPGAPDWHPPTADTVMTEAMRNKLAGLQRMKNRTGPTKQARRVTALRQVEESWRQAARKEIWLRQHWAERRKSVQDAERDTYLAARGSNYSQKVEKLRDEQFKKDVVSQRKSRKLRQAQRDRRILKEMFQQAVELEKEKILDDVKRQKAGAAQQAAKEGRSGQTSHGSYTEAVVRENWAHMSDVLASERQQRNAVEHQQGELLRSIDRERQSRAKADRRAELVRLADEEGTAYWRAAHPKHEGPWFNNIWHSAAQYKA